MFAQVRIKYIKNIQYILYIYLYKLKRDGIFHLLLEVY